MHAVYRSFIAAEAANDPELAALLAKNAALEHEAQQQQQQQQQGQIKALRSGAGAAESAASPHGTTDLLVDIEAAGVAAAVASSTAAQVRPLAHPIVALLGSGAMHYYWVLFLVHGGLRQQHHCSVRLHSKHMQL
jgi:hypothetical protein